MIIRSGTKEQPNAVLHVSRFELKLPFKWVAYPFRVFHVIPRIRLIDSRVNVKLDKGVQLPVSDNTCVSIKIGFSTYRILIAKQHI